MILLNGLNLFLPDTTKRIREAEQKKGRKKKKERKKERKKKNKTKINKQLKWINGGQATREAGGNASKPEPRARQTWQRTPWRSAAGGSGGGAAAGHFVSQKKMEKDFFDLFTL